LFTHRSSVGFVRLSNAVTWCRLGLESFSPESSRHSLKLFTARHWLHTILYGTKCNFNVRSKADISGKIARKKLKSKKTDKVRSIGKQSGESVESVHTYHVARSSAVAAKLVSGPSGKNYRRAHLHVLQLR